MIIMNIIKVIKIDLSWEITNWNKLCSKTIEYSFQLCTVI